VDSWESYVKSWEIAGKIQFIFLSIHPPTAKPTRETPISNPKPKLENDKSIFSKL
jgi:hypothetical protein